MKKLSPEAMQIVARGRSDNPTPNDKERVRRHLSAALAASAGVAAAATGGRALAAAWGPKVLATIALAAGGVALVGALRQPLSSAPPPRPPAVAAAQTDRPAAQASPAPEPAGPDELAEPGRPTGEKEPPPAASKARVPAAHRLPAREKESALGPPPPAPALSLPEDALVAETSALSEVQAALRAGHAEEALQLVEQHLQRFRGGALDQEREAARILALCQLGRLGAAKEDLEGFERTYPDSPLLPRLRAACAPR